MRYIFWFFLVLSLALHILIIGFLQFDKLSKPEEKPIQVQLLPKEKEKAPQPPVTKQPPQQQKTPDYKRNVPLDEGLDTKIEETRPAIKKELKGSKDEPEKKQEPLKSEKPALKPYEPKPAPQQAVPEIPEEKTANLPRMSNPRELDTGKELLSKADREKLDKIMNPQDVIEKYAQGEGKVSGEDSVSMQDVKMRYQSYFYKFARRLYQVWQYPESAAYRGEQGVVQASFNIDHDGNISSIRILKSSGYPDLDNEVVYALKKMSGVPLPESYDLDTLKVNAYFKYILNTGFLIY